MTEVKKKYIEKKKHFHNDSLMCLLAFLFLMSSL
jgi:hypothetical protein